MSRNETTLATSFPGRNDLRKRHLILATAVMVALAITIGTAANAGSQESRSDLGSTPNILLVLIDDVGIEHMSMYGVGTTGFAQTPNLTSLANGGLLFTQAWSSPACSMTRSAMHTGRHGMVTGQVAVLKPGDMGLPLTETTFATALKTSTNYATGAFGKWHMGMHPDQGGFDAPGLHGYDHFEGVEGNLGSYFDYTKITDGVAQPVSGYVTTDTVDWAIGWIGQQTSPWLAYVALNAAHDPFHWPPDELHTQDTTQPGSVAKYRAMIEAMDTELGRLIDSVDLGNTLIIWASDNGSPQAVASPPVVPNEAKSTVYQGGVRVPMGIFGLGITPGEVTRPIQLLDIFATILELSGATPPATGNHSESLVPYFSDVLAPGRPLLLTEAMMPNGFGPYNFASVASRNDRFKLHLSNTGEKLYDVLADPWEDVDLLLAPTADSQAAYTELKQYILEIWKQR